VVTLTIQYRWIFFLADYKKIVWRIHPVIDPMVHRRRPRAITTTGRVDKKRRAGYTRAMDPCICC